MLTNDLTSTYTARELVDAFDDLTELALLACSARQERFEGAYLLKLQTLRRFLLNLEREQAEPVGA